MEEGVTSADKNVGEKVVAFLECSCFQAYILYMLQLERTKEAVS